MEALASITSTDGELMKPEIVSKSKNAPKLQIVPPKPTSVVADDETEEDYDEESSSEVDGFYVELSLACTNDEGDRDEQLLVFNFETEENYNEYVENGFEDLEGYFNDAVNANCPMWTYADEFEEHHVYGNEYPDFDGIIVDVF